MNELKCKRKLLILKLIDLENKIFSIDDDDEYDQKYLRLRNKIVLQFEDIYNLDKQIHESELLTK